MSTLRKEELARRKQALLVRSAELRLTLAYQSQALRPPLALLDQVRSGLHWLRTHPQWPLGAFLLTAVWRPRRMLRWASRLGWGWSLYKRARLWWSQLPRGRT